MADADPSVPAVSIITSVYNTRPYLQRMLQSVLEQSLENIEHIVIDDGSTDGSGAMLDEYRTAHPQRRISVIHQSNSGVPAYNPGLDAARGEYVAFLDHDDYLAPDFCELLYRRAVAEDADICKGEAVAFTDEQRRTPPTRVNAEIRQLRSKLRFIYYFWTAIYRRQLLEEHHLRFSEQIILGQDTLFQNEVVLACRHLALEDRALYYVNAHPQSISSVQSGYAPPKVDALLTAYRRILANLIRQRRSCDVNGLGYVVMQLMLTLLTDIGHHVHEPSDAKRCEACAKELLKRCPMQAQGLVRSNLKQHYPQLAAQLRIR